MCASLGYDMSRLLISFFVYLSASLANKQTIPIGIVVDSREQEVITMLELLMASYNNSTDSGNSIIISPFWYIANLENSCDLIRAICRCLDSGAFLLLGSSSGRSYNIIQSYSQALHVPYVVYSQTTNNARDGYSYDVSISPSYVRALSDVIKYFNWPKVYYIFDSDNAATISTDHPDLVSSSALWELQRLHDSFRSPIYDLVVDARRIRNVSSAHEFLRHMDKCSTFGGVRRIILNLSSRDNYQTVLNQLVDVGMNRRNYHYFLSGPYIDDLDLRSFLYGGVNVTGFRLPIDLTEVTPSYPHSLTTTRISTDAALAGDGLRLVHQAFNSLLVTTNTRHARVFKSSLQPELYSNVSRGVQCWRQPPAKWVHGPIVKEALLETMVSGMTGPVIFDENGVRTGYKLDLMHLEYRTPLRKVGTWTFKDKVVTSLPRPETNQVRLDLNRTRIVTTILEFIECVSSYEKSREEWSREVPHSSCRFSEISENPFVMMKCPADGTPCHGNDQFEGYCIDLLKLLAEKINFDYRIKLVDDNAYGSKQLDGSWNGMIGELLTNKADLAIASLTITEMRERYVDFSKPFMQLGTSLMIKNPDKEKGGVFSFKNPLSDGVWLAIICGFLGVSFVLFFVGRFSAYEVAQGSTEKTQPAFSLANTIWFSLGALMQQGSDIYPRSISGRIVGTAWWFFTLIIISSYTANLAAFLTIERMVIPINSADDLVKQSEIHYGFIANGSTEEFFRVSNVTVYSKMWNFMKNARPSVFVKTTQEGVDRVRSSKGKYAFLLDSSFNEYHNQKKPCNTMRVGRDLDVKGYGIATPRFSDLRININIAVLELNEVGELLKLHQKWWYDKGQCAPEAAKQESTTSALTLSNVSGIFHILIGGLILAMLTAFCDFLIKRKLRQRSTMKAARKVTHSHQEAEVLPVHLRFRRPSNENGECGFATMETSLSREFEQHRCRHVDEVL